MGIVAFCPRGHRINVKESLAGKTGVCPTCGEKFSIPATAAGVPATAAGELPPAARALPTARLLDIAADVVAGLPRVLPFEVPSPEPAFTPPPEPAAPPPPTLHPALAERPELEWCIAFPGGEPTEPLSAESMQAWLESGQAAGTEVVWRSDWPEWRPARDVFPTPAIRGQKHP